MGDEVRALLARGLTERDPAMNATGYIEMIGHLRGDYDIAAAADLIRRATRRYARRQLTWLRNQLPSDAVHLDALLPVSELADEVVLRWTNEMSTASRAEVQS